MNPIVELTIDKLVYGGYGLAFSAGRAYFILNALPGEKVRAEIVREKKNTAFGKAIEVLERSSLRIEPPCPHFMRCGGCHLQHLAYLDQLKFKEEILRETFRRIGQMTLAGIEIVSGEPWHYRTRAQLKVGREGDSVDIGFFAAQSHHLWPIDRCPLLAEKLNNLLEGIQRERQKFSLPGASVEEFQLRTNGDESQVAMDFLGTPPELDCAMEESSLSSKGLLVYRTECGDFRVGSNSFFQVNRYLLEPLVARSVEAAEGNIALDLFAGVGLFTVPLARRFSHVVAVEANPAALSDLRANLGSNDCGNVEVIGSDVASVLRWNDEQWKNVDFVLLDPPRQGVKATVIRQLIAQSIPRCVYVSCDPTSMARDVKMLCGGGFEVRKVWLFDFFPQTYHFETVVQLERSGREKSQGADLIAHMSAEADVCVAPLP
jgi:23S rRNA (uracil1939-C5)-methyltransferase